MTKSKESASTAGKIIWGVVGLAAVGLAAVVTLSLIKGEGAFKEVFDHWLKPKPHPEDQEA